jgi:hypothetical protein
MPCEPQEQQNNDQYVRKTVVMEQRTKKLKKNYYWFQFSKYSSFYLAETRRAATLRKLARDTSEPKSAYILNMYAELHIQICTLHTQYVDRLCHTISAALGEFAVTA